MNKKPSVIGIMSNLSRDKNYALTQALVHYLLKRKIKIELAKEIYTFFTDENQEDKKIDHLILNNCRAGIQDAELVMVLGGDGSILKATHLLPSLAIPLVGINIGSLGFMSEIQLDDIVPKIEQILAGEYEIKERMLLKVDVYKKDNTLRHQTFALNDVVFQRLSHSRVASYELSINEDAIEKIPADGLVIASPTGSTAYALAAGGPIVSPDLCVFIITPICPHTLQNRSYVCDGKDIIQVASVDLRARISLNIDGYENIRLMQGEYTVITQYAEKVRFIHLEKHNFYVTLPEKLQRRTIVNRDLKNIVRSLKKSIEHLENDR